MKELLHLLQDCMVGIFPSGSIVHTFLRSGTVQPRVSFPGKNLLFHWSFLQKLSITAVSAYTLDGEKFLRELLFLRESTVNGAF